MIDDSPDYIGEIDPQDIDERYGPVIGEELRACFLVTSIVVVCSASSMVVHVMQGEERSLTATEHAVRLARVAAAAAADKLELAVQTDRIERT